MRTLDKQAYRTLKATTKNLVQQVGGQDAASCFTRICRQRLSDYGNLQKPDSNMPVDVVLDLEKTLGDPLVTRRLAMLQGFALILLPEARPGNQDVQELARIAQEFGDVVERVGKCLSDDGHISPDEIRKHALLGELDELISASVDMKASLEVRLKEYRS